MTTIEIITTVLGACLVVASISTIICCVLIRNRHLKTVQENSELYKKILKLNDSYTFYTDFLSKYEFFETCASKRKLENLSLDDVLMAKIEENLDFFQNLLIRVQKNREIFELYCKRYDNLASEMNEEKIAGLKIKLETFLKIESGICKKAKLTPLLSSSIFIQASYTSPQGRNSYSKEITLSYEETVNAYNRYIRLKNQQRVYSYQVKTERAKMNDSLRYDIFKRDKFRCQICGATAKEGAKLHVDHIVPVSKGGKTVYSNLRTLCDRCNMGKSNKIE